MSDKELEGPTHEQIQKRAHELYLARGGEHGQDRDDWLFAEEQLRREHDERVGIKTTAFVAGPGGVATIDSPFDKDLVVAEEERRQVRGSEKLKKERESSTLPRTKTVAVGQQKEK